MLFPGFVSQNLNRGQDTRANTVREPEPTHNELKHFLPGILPGPFSRKKRASLASYQSRPPRPGNFSATTQQRSPGGNFFSVRFSELLALGTAFGSSKVELTCSPRAFSSPPQSTMLRLVLALCVAAASGTLRLRVVAPARAAETSLPPLWRRTMGAAGGGCGDCAQRGCSIELRTRRRAASSSAGG